MVSVKHFILFIAFVFTGLFFAVLNKNDNAKTAENMPVVRVFAYSSFTSKWGAGPALKDLFEKTCNCKLEYIEGSDSGILLQRLKIEGESLGADVVVGLDQFDISKAATEQNWRKLSIQGVDTYDHVRATFKNGYFIPYDWGVLSFISRKGELTTYPQNIDDLLEKEYFRRISLQDPRTSSPGMQFLYWVLKVKGEEEGFNFIKKMNDQVHSYSPSWSTSYGLFTNKQSSLVYSYTTSPLYHKIEEKNDSYISLPFQETLASQYEFVGVPNFCKNCQLAEKFVNMMLSEEGQKILMTKNYMMPVRKGVAEGTDFEVALETGKILPFEVLSNEEVERILKIWTDIRRGSRN